MPSEFLRLKAAMPVHGVGIGLRGEICEQTLAHKHVIDFLEFTPENYRANNATIGWLSGFAEHFPLVSHSVSLSIGSIDPLDRDFLKMTRTFLKRFGLQWWSDHLCFSGVDGEHGNDLFPLPWTEETVKHVASKVKQAQELVEYPLLLENIPYYTKMPQGDFDEAEFIGRVLEEADCGLLLDINNLFVNSINHEFDPLAFLDRLPLERVVQIHLAGPGRFGKRTIDTHGSAVPQPVFALLDYVLSKKIGACAVMIERDQYFPKFEEMLEEILHVRQIWDKHVEKKLERKDRTQNLPVAEGASGMDICVEKSTRNDSERENSQNLSPIELTSHVPPPVVAELAALPTEPEELLLSTEPAQSGKNLSAAAIDTSIVYKNLAEYERRWFGLWVDTIGTEPHEADADSFQPRFARKPVATDGYDMRAISIYTWLRDSNRDSLLRNVYPSCYKVLLKDWQDLLLSYFYEYRAPYNDNATLGDRFPEFLKRHCRQYQSQYPFVYELAEFEQMKNESARTHQYTDFSATVYLGSTEQIKTYKPVVNPELSIQSFIYPVLEIAEQLKEDLELAPAAMDSPAVLAFLPQSWSSKIIRLTTLSLRLIDAARVGKNTYSQLIAACMTEEQRNSPEEIANFIRLFQTLHDQKIFIGCIPADYNFRWSSYSKAVAQQEPHQTVILALENFEKEKFSPGLAIDLGCGSGRDAKRLLSQGWNVFALDQSQESLDCLLEAANGWKTEQLQTHLGAMQDAELPSADLINAGISLPFCPPEDFQKLWKNVCKALKPGGRFAGHFFGNNDDWAVNKGMTFFSAAEIKELLKGFELEFFNEIEGQIPLVPTGFRHGQVFEVVARKLN